MGSFWHRKMMILRQTKRLDGAPIGNDNAAKDHKKENNGATSGAHDQYSEEAEKHAELYYEEVRKRHGDVDAIAKNTDFTESQVNAVLHYVFLDEHDLDEGRKRFDPSFAMAESWRRLVEGKNIQKHDVTMMKHELMERKLVMSGMSQREAHIKATKKYDYHRESDEYYAGLKKNKKDG